jgi:hypothetical protein
MSSELPLKADIAQRTRHVRKVPTPDLPHISGIIPDAATTHLCHSFLTFDAPSRGERSKSEMSRVIFALARTLRFAVTLPKLNIMISQKANRRLSNHFPPKFLFKPETRAQSFL